MCGLLTVQLATPAVAGRLNWRSPSNPREPQVSAQEWTARSARPVSPRTNTLRPERGVRAAAHQAEAQPRLIQPRPIQTGPRLSRREQPVSDERPLRSVIVDRNDATDTAPAMPIDSRPTRPRATPRDPFGQDRDHVPSHQDRAVDPFSEDQPPEPAELTLPPAAIEEADLARQPQPTTREWTRRAPTLVANQPGRVDSESVAQDSRTRPEPIPKSCEDALKRLRESSIYDVDLDVSVDGEVPEDCYVGQEPYTPRDWPEVTFMWKASALCHKPLYFEDVQLERYGHSWGPYAQPLISGAHFFVTLPILPYKMGLKTPNECVYSLGYYRPGNCAPYLIPAVPFTWRAAVFEAGAVVGFSAIIP